MIQDKAQAEGNGELGTPSWGRRVGNAELGTPSWGRRGEPRSRQFMVDGVLTYQKRIFIFPFSGLFHIQATNIILFPTAMAVVTKQNTH